MLTHEQNALEQSKKVKRMSAREQTQKSSEAPRPKGGASKKALDRELLPVRVDDR